VTGVSTSHEVGFDQVDRSVDPREFVSYLDAVSACQGVHAMKLRGAEQACANSVISPDELAAWISDLDQRAESNSFFAAITGFWVSGRKP